MGAILIKGDPENNKIIEKLAKKLGSNVHSIKDEEYEDIVFGKMMEESKTGKVVIREEIMKKLKNE